MDRKIIIALIIIVLIALAGLLSFSAGIKTDTKIDFLSGSNLKNGNQIDFELVDAQGNALSNQEIKITFRGVNETQNFTITTDDNGKGSLILKDEKSGNYTVSVSYDGDDKHNGCSANQKITIKDGTSENSTANYTTDESSTRYTSGDSSYSSTYSDSSQSSDDSDIIQSGQNKGISRKYLEENQPRVVDGNLE